MNIPFKNQNFSRMWRRIALGLVVWMPMSLAESAQKAGSETTVPTVLTTIRPLALLVSDIAEGTVKVETLLSPNDDPHHHALSIRDRQRLEQAERLLWLGADFERYLVDLVQSHPHSLALTTLSDLQWPATPAIHAGRDGHIWLNPHNVAIVWQAIADMLSALRPQYAARYQANLAQHLALLKTFQAETDTQFAPLRQVGFGAHHGGYDHWVTAFSLKQLAVVSYLSEDRLSARDLLRLQQELKEARCLLADAQTPASQRIADNLGIPLVVADSLASSIQVDSYLAFLTQLRQSFVQCLSSPPSQPPK